MSRRPPNSVAFSTSQRKRSTLGTAVASTISTIRRGRIAAANAETQRGRRFRQSHDFRVRLGPRSVENGQMIAGPAAQDVSQMMEFGPRQLTPIALRQVRQKIPVGHRHLSGRNRGDGRPIVMPLYRFCRL